MNPTPLIRSRSRILDSSFHYKPSFDTDIRQTFARARAQQAREKAEGPPNVLHLDLPRKSAAA
jgi:hypothetical protein